MKSVNINKRSTSYLDVSEFIIKEHSPVIKSTPPPNQIMLEELQNHHTPQINPIDHDTSLFVLTPLINGLISSNIHQILDDFNLDYQDEQITKKRNEHHRKKLRKNDHSTAFTLQFPKLQCQLEEILQVDADQYSQGFFSSSEDISSEESSEQEESYPQNRLGAKLSQKLTSKDSKMKEVEQEKQSTIDILTVDYSQIIQRFMKNPKNQMVKKIKELEADKAISSEEEKIQLIKIFLQQYLLEYELEDFEQFWTEIVHKTHLKGICQAIIKRIELTFGKKIGNLSFQMRRVKLLRYLQKKRKRIWRKKVSYDCRKKVADGRLRIKGKFVTREQACEQLGLENLDNYSAQEIKQMLQKKSQESLNQPILC